MTSWQRSARLAVLVFGVATGIVVYFGLRERQPAVSYGQAPRLDPKAISESYHGALQEVSGARKTFELTFSKTVSYEDGSTKLFDVRIASRNRDGRNVVVTAQHAQAQGNGSYDLGGGVMLRDSEGFELTTPEAQYDAGSMIVQAAGAVTFSKGRMRGAGVGMTYDLPGDVLSVAESARVDVDGRDTASSMRSRSGSARLDRRNDLLTLDRDVHAVRGLQVTSADRAVARLSAGEDVITFVELRGRAKVEGGTGSLQSMQAHDIDLDYTDDGRALERSVLVGEAAVVLAGEGGAEPRRVSADRAEARLSAGNEAVSSVELRGHARVEGGAGPLRSMRASDIDLGYADGGGALERAVLSGDASVALAGRNGSAGRGVSADRLEAALSPEGTLRKLTGAGHVSMSLPADREAPARAIHSDTMEGAGGAGGTLTSARFDGHVVFQEQASGRGRPRTARSRGLAVEMSDETISSAVFTGAATFEQDDLRAAAAEARYEPDAGRLALSGSEGGARPSVRDQRLRVEAATIDVGLEQRTFDAKGTVKTLLNPAAKTPSRGTTRPASDDRSRLPGIFDQDQAVNVTSARLVHEGEGGWAKYSGGVWLFQGEKEIRADAIDINQTSGDLVATGNARSILVFESGRSDGQAPRIRYTDATGVIGYGPSSESQPAAQAGSRLRGAQGDLAATRIDVHLVDRQVDRIEGTDAVTVVVDGKTITGQRFTYRTQGDRYEVMGTAAAPGRVRDESCHETVGKKLTFDRSADTMTVDDRTMRMQTKNPCRAPAAR